MVHLTHDRDKCHRGHSLGQSHRQLPAQYLYLIQLAYDVVSQSSNMFDMKVEVCSQGQPKLETWRCQPCAAVSLTSCCIRTPSQMASLPLPSKVLDQLFTSIEQYLTMFVIIRPMIQFPSFSSGLLDWRLFYPLIFFMYSHPFF